MSSKKEVNNTKYDVTTSDEDWEIIDQVDKWLVEKDSTLRIVEYNKIQKLLKRMKEDRMK